MRTCKFCKIEQQKSEFKMTLRQVRYSTSCNTCEQWAIDVSKELLNDLDKVPMNKDGERIYIEFLKGEIY